MFPEFDQVLNWMLSDVLRLPAGLIAVIALARWALGILSEAHKLGETVGSIGSVVLGRLPSLLVLLFGHILLAGSTALLTYLAAGVYLQEKEAEQAALWAMWGVIAYLAIVDWFSLRSGDSVTNPLLFIGLYAAGALFIAAAVPIVRDRSSRPDMWLSLGGWLLVAVLWWRLFVWASGAAFEMVVRRRTT